VIAEGDSNAFRWSFFEKPTDEFQDGILVGTLIDVIAVEHQHILVVSSVDGIVVDSNDWVVLGVI
jgi:hypothetical protein